MMGRQISREVRQRELRKRIFRYVAAGAALVGCILGIIVFSDGQGLGLILIREVLASHNCRFSLRTR